MRNQARYTLLVIATIFMCSFQASALEKKTQKTHKVKPEYTEPAPEVRSSSEDLLAIPVGGFIGFGLGHALQYRYLEHGWVFTALDTASLFYIARTFGDCGPSDDDCSDNQDKDGRVGAALFLGSRIAQMIDLTYFYSQHSYVADRPKQNLYFAVIPTGNGSIQTNFGWAF